MNSKDTFFSQKLTINCQGRLIEFSLPRIMGILNITPDSFYDGGKYITKSAVRARVLKLVEQGADMVDVGACSTRPGSVEISSEIEKSRLKMALEIIRKEFPDLCLCIDTFRSDIAEYAIREFGAAMINDIYAGRYDDRMFRIVAEHKVPIILMHMQGTPQTMQKNPVYQDVVKEVISFFAERAEAARLMGVKDIILDPGFGFGKSMKDNFRLLRELDLFSMLGMPVMVGISRKAMIYKSINGKPEDALNGTTVLNTLALHNGAKLLRVHDVKEAAEVVRLFSIYHDSKN